MFPTTTRTRAILLCLALCFAGCASSAESTTSAGSSIADPATTTPADTTPPSAPSTDVPAGPSPDASTTTSAPGPETTIAATTTTLPPRGIRPTRIEIPSIDVDTTIIDLDIRGTEPEVPTDFAEVGWYSATRKPGEIGPAVLAGHIDSQSGPAVFFRLDQLVAGDRIVVHGNDATTRTFEVVGAGQYPKTDLPDEVFGFGDPTSELRLITCGGSFDRNSGHYDDNLVVYATEIV